MKLVVKLSSTEYTTEGLRIVAIEKAKDLAGQFNLYSDRIENLKKEKQKKPNNSLDRNIPSRQSISCLCSSTQTVP